MEKALSDILDREMGLVRDLNRLTIVIESLSRNRVDLLMNDDCELTAKSDYIKYLQNEIDRMNEEKFALQERLTDVRMELKSYFKRNILN